MTAEKTRQFRLKQSEEKIDIAKRLLSKGDYGNALAQAYLSIFYSVRVLLLEKGADSDDFEKIVSLSEEYFQPIGWLSRDISQLLEKGRTLHEQIERNNKNEVSIAEALSFIENAEKIRKAVEKA